MIKTAEAPKESNNGDKSLHGLMVALAMAGTIAGSVILFAYVSSADSVPKGSAGTVNQVAPAPEKPVAAEMAADEQACAENSVYVNSTLGVQDPVIGYVELEKSAYAGINNTKNNSEDQVSIGPDEQKNEQQNAADRDQGNIGETDEQESQDTIQKRVLDVLDKIVDVDDHEHKDGKGHKGKG